MADRVRVAASRKRGGAKRTVKKTRRARSRRLGFIGLAFLAVLILGFLTRRVMIPSAVHYLAYRPADQPQSVNDGERPATTDDSAERNGDASQDERSDSEHLSTSDRRELDAIVKRKGK